MVTPTKLSSSLSRNSYAQFVTHKNSEPDSVFEGIDLESEVKKSLVDNIKRRLTPQPLKIRADVEVTCFHYEGIDAIKAALQKGIDTTTAETPITVAFW
jgi:translation initiation factor 2 subunit 1